MLLDYKHQQNKSIKKNFKKREKKEIHETKPQEIQYT